ncbi:reverse transcriptase-like protein [Candidatus Woesearchaeota archaeon]|nr:reverse transcriptase-like protein [Candidatus Woesearchaeota archaeon]
MKQKDGIRLVEPSPNLAQAYLQKAENALISMKLNTVQEWKIATAYYTLYFSLYSVLMKIGVACEIPSCTIELAKQYLRQYFTEEDIALLRDALRARIDSQYYTDRTVSEKTTELMMQKTPYMLVKCREIIERLTEKDVAQLRNAISKNATSQEQSTSAKKIVILNCDGGSRGNPGPAAIGVVVWDEKRNVLLKHHERIGHTTNNVAEYTALLRALELAQKYTTGTVHVFMDSEVVIRQMNNEYIVRAKHLLPLHNKAKETEKKFERVTYTHVPRENKYQTEADKLVNTALDGKSAPDGK